MVEAVKALQETIEQNKSSLMCWAVFAALAVILCVLLSPFIYRPGIRSHSIVTIIHCSQSGTNSSITCMVAKSVTTEMERDSTSLVFHGVTAYGPSIAGGIYAGNGNVPKTEALQLSLRLPNETLLQANGEILKVNTFAKRIGTIPQRRTE